MSEAAGAVLPSWAPRPMLDPAWTPARAYGHAQGLLEAVARKEDEVGKRMRAIERELPPGYRLERQRNSHYLVVRPDGEPLRMPGGLPVQVAFSTGDGNMRAAVTRVRKALRGQS